MTPNHLHPKYEGDQTDRPSPLDLTTPKDSCFEGNQSQMEQEKDKTMNEIDIDITIKAEQRRLSILKSRSHLSSLNILSIIRSKVSFWGVISLVDS